MVLAAKESAPEESLRALETLCQAYWQPLYIYARRQGQSPQDAEDLTQGFFARLLEKGFLQTVQQEKGRFRQFMLMAFQRHMANEWDHARRLKRGGGHKAVPLDTVLGERLYREDTSPDASADEAYDRRWALSLLDQTLGRLRAEFRSSGKEREFDVLKVQLTAAGPAGGGGTDGYTVIAGQLGCTEGAARVAVHRLRKRFREIFREEIAQTVEGEEALEQEVRHLVEVLAKSGGAAPGRQDGF